MHPFQVRVTERIRALMENKTILQEVVEKTRQHSAINLGPMQEAWSENQKILSLNQTQTDEIVKAIAGGNVQGPLWQVLNDKTAQLHLKRERLLIEERRIEEQLTPRNENFDASGIEALPRDFSTLARCAEPEEIQRLLRLAIRRIEWKTQGNCKVQFYHLPKRGSTKTNGPPAQSASGPWLYTGVCKDTP